MKTLEEINKIREEKRKELDLRVNLDAVTCEKHILVCKGAGCTLTKAPEIIEKFKKILKQENIKDVKVIRNRLLWTLYKRTNSCNKTRRYILC